MLENISNYRQYLKNTKIFFMLPTNDPYSVLLRLLEQSRGRVRVLELHDLNEIIHYYHNKIPIYYADDYIDIIGWNGMMNYDELSIFDNSYIKMGFLVELCPHIFHHQYFFHLDNFLPPNYVLRDQVFEWDSNLCFKYGLKTEINNGRIQVFSGLSYYGDSIICLPVIQHFINNCVMPVDMLHLDKKESNIFCAFIKNCNHIEVQSKDKEKELFFSKNDIPYAESYNLINIMQNKNKMYADCHFIDMYRDLLNIEQPISDIVNSYYPSTYISKEQKNCIDAMKKKYRYLLGTQFYTNTNDQENWSKESIMKFINLCQEYDCGIINFGYWPDQLPDCVVDMRQYTVSELFGVMKLVDLFVGIDSCFGHMAGIVNVPSLSVFLRDTPLKHENQMIGYRVIRNNFSLASPAEKCVKISPDLVFSYAKQILDKKIKLSNDYISYQESKKGKNIHWLTC